MKLSPIYTKYENTAWSSVSLSTLQTDLDAILDTSVESLPLIRYLTSLQKAKYIEDSMESTTKDSYLKNIMRGIQGLHYSNGIPADSTPALVTNNFVRNVSHTLSGGALANSPIYQPGSSKKAWLFWLQMGVKDAAQGAVNYDIDVQDEDDTEIFAFNWLGSEGYQYWMEYNHLTNNKDIELDISGGAGTEVLWSLNYAGYYQ